MVYGCFTAIRLLKSSVSSHSIAGFSDRSRSS
ncbi:hypothetical protein LINPERHAP1_LOCUS25020 [Linum perenne]